MSRNMSPVAAKLKRKRNLGEKSSREKPLALRKIEKILSKSKTYLGAIYLSSFKDLLVKAKKYSLIIFCDNHWFCIFSTEKTFEIFDPLGFLQKSKCFSVEFLAFIRAQIGRKILYSNPKVQGDQSFSCGYFVCFFILSRELGHSFNEIISRFSKNFRKNQILVKLFLEKLKNS